MTSPARPTCSPALNRMYESRRDWREVWCAALARELAKWEEA
jgi:hypothetical protein